MGTFTKEKKWKPQFSSLEELTFVLMNSDTNSFEKWCKSRSTGLFRSQLIRPPDCKTDAHLTNILQRDCNFLTPQNHVD